jgi:hypothetical protein
MPFVFEIAPQRPRRRNSAITWSKSCTACMSSSSGGSPFNHSAHAATIAPSMQCARRVRSTTRIELHVSPFGSKFCFSS